MGLVEDADYIRQTIRALHRHFEKALQKKVEQSGITLPQLRVIKAVVAEPGVSVTQLKEKLQMTQSTVSGIVDRLVRNALLVKQVHPSDGRSTLISPAPAVARFLENEQAEFVNETVIQALNRLSEEQRIRVVDSIRTLAEAVTAVSEEGAP